ncbi:hypothetical protein WEH80_26890 [Actinomycetes bacterium KLBMP 9759]
MSARTLSITVRRGCFLPMQELLEAVEQPLQSELELLIRIRYESPLAGQGTQRRERPHHVGSPHSLLQLRFDLDGQSDGNTAHETAYGRVRVEELGPIEIEAVDGPQMPFGDPQQVRQRLLPDERHHMRQPRMAAIARPLHSDRCLEPLRHPLGPTTGSSFSNTKSDIAQINASMSGTCSCRAAVGIPRRCAMVRKESDATPSR